MDTIYGGVNCVGIKLRTLICINVQLALHEWDTNCIVDTVIMELTVWRYNFRVLNCIVYS